MIIMITMTIDHSDVNSFHLIVHNGVDINGDVVASQNLKQVRFVLTHLIVHDRIHKNGDAVFRQNLGQKDCQQNH